MAAIENTICLRDGSDDFPAQIPPIGIHVLSVEWSFGMLNSRMDKYKAAFSKDMQTVFVWMKDTYWVEDEPPTNYEPYCAGPANGDLIASALLAIETAWAFEKDEYDLDAPHILGWVDPKYQQQYEEIEARVWGDEE